MQSTFHIQIGWISHPFVKVSFPVGLSTSADWWIGCISVFLLNHLITMYWPLMKSNWYIICPFYICIHAWIALRWWAWMGCCSGLTVLHNPASFIGRLVAGCGHFRLTVWPMIFGGSLAEWSKILEASYCLWINVCNENHQPGAFDIKKMRISRFKIATTNS